jgi:hypothetical protein
MCSVVWTSSLYGEVWASKTIRLPVGDQDGLAYQRGPLVCCRTSVPSAFAVKICALPSASLRTKASLVPSGEKAGCSALARTRLSVFVVPS